MATFDPCGRREHCAAWPGFRPTLTAPTPSSTVGSLDRFGGIRLWGADQVTAQASSVLDRPRDARIYSAGTPRVRRRPPQFGGGIVKRTRLLARVAGARKCLVVVLHAPAGFGKTIAAAQLSQNDPRPAYWIRLEDNDNDPIVFVSGIVEMLEEMGPIPARLARELESRAPRINAVVVPLLREQLAICDPFLVVLDDVERLTDPGSSALLAFLVAEVPQGSQLVLTTRRQPALPLAGLRAAGEVLDLGPDDLALDVTETRELLASDGLELSDERVQAIRNRTEGWAAGIALALLVPDGLGGGATLTLFLSRNRARWRPT